MPSGKLKSTSLETCGPSAAASTRSKSKNLVQERREEIRRLETKYKEDESDSDSEESDAEAVLATEKVDNEINAVINAIKSKDPRLKNKDFNWYPSLDEAEKLPMSKPKAQKPLTLRDYHRINLLKDANGEHESEDDSRNVARPKTYVQEQAELREELANQIAQQAETSSDGEDFFKPKEAPDTVDAADDQVHPSRSSKVAGKVNLQAPIPNPDQDPEGFLTKYLSSRGWVDQDSHKWEAFESDDDEEDERMEQLEHAFNMRFENPEKSNELIRTYARTDRSVRREKKSARQAKREQEKLEREEQKQRIAEERARLRRLKLEENQYKLEKIKEAAGLINREIDDNEIMRLLDEAWDDEKWEETMQKRFGEEYYAEKDLELSGDDDSDTGDDSGHEGCRKLHPQKASTKKPEWDDDIDIKDIVPDFEDGDEQPDIALSEEEGLGHGSQDDDDNGDGAIDVAEQSVGRPAKKSKDRKRERQEKKSEARKERRQLEALVDAKLELEDPTVLKTSKKHAGFRYRETSPVTFGLTARDILLAPSDASLNEFAGLKRYATWRDPEKKKKDKKKLAKKARLRTWRAEVYGDKYSQTGPTFGFEKFIEDGPGKKDFEDPDTEEQSKWTKLREKAKEKRKRKREEREATAAAAEAGVEAGAAAGSGDVGKNDAPAEDAGDGERKTKKRRKRKSMASRKEGDILDT